MELTCGDLGLKDGVIKELYEKFMRWKADVDPTPVADQKLREEIYRALKKMWDYSPYDCCRLIEVFIIDATCGDDHCRVHMGTVGRMNAMGAKLLDVVFDILNWEESVSKIAGKIDEALSVGEVPYRIEKIE